MVGLTWTCTNTNAEKCKLATGALKKARSWAARRAGQLHKIFTLFFYISRIFFYMTFWNGYEPVCQAKPRQPQASISRAPNAVNRFNPRHVRGRKARPCSTGDARLRQLEIIQQIRTNPALIPLLGNPAPRKRGIWSEFPNTPAL